MIYDISKYSLKQLQSDERLISELMKTSSEMTTTDAKSKIKLAYELCRSLKKPEPVAVGGDVCPSCGSSEMIRTGVCLTCKNCGNAGSCG